MTSQRGAGGAGWGWQQHNFRAMSTGVHLSMYTPVERTPGRHVEGLFRYFDQLLSRFRPASELSRLNGHDDTAFAASPDLFAAVEAALWAAQQSGGIYDPTILPDLERAGYDRTFEALQAMSSGTADNKLRSSGSAPAAGIRSGPTYHDMALDRFSGMIYRPVGLRLDLGGMGKGWTVDRAADDLRPGGAFMLNAGGDLYASSAPHRERGWQAHLAHPRSNCLFASVSISNKALATSTTARRRWTKDGVRQHHLIDPRTGCPAVTDALSVSVIGERVFTAEIHAKVALILGLSAGLDYLEALPDVEAVLFGNDNSVQLTTGMSRYLDRLDPNGYSDTVIGD